MDIDFFFYIHHVRNRMTYDSANTSEILVKNVDYNNIKITMYVFVKRDIFEGNSKLFERLVHIQWMPLV